MEITRIFRAKNIDHAIELMKEMEKQLQEVKESESIGFLSVSLTYSTFTVDGD